jgi:catechol-2,3-dioxygenase
MELHTIGVLNGRHPIHSARDHGCTLSVYLQDPDGNGIELYYDRPRQNRLGSAGVPVIESEPLDLGAWMGRIPSGLLTELRPSDVPVGRAEQGFSEVL